MDDSSHECIELLCVSLKHLFRQPPEDEKGCHGEKKGAQEQEAALYLLWLLHGVGFGKMQNVTRSRFNGRSQLDFPDKGATWIMARFLSRQLASYRGFCTASTSLSPLPLENTGLSIVPPIRKGNCSLPSFNVAPEKRATVFVKKLSLVVISANPR